MRELSAHEGRWVGTNGFRLMPADAVVEAPITATVSPAAKGGLTQLAYTWVHADDGEQQGLLVIGPGEDDGSVSAFWGDSWHQKPEPRALAGTYAGDVVTVAYTYAGNWRWEIAVDASAPDALTLTMRNVIPASAAGDTMEAGPYAAMHAELRRSR